MRACSLLIAFACGCTPTAGAHAPQNAPSNGKSEKGRQCLTDARAPRHPRTGAPAKIEISHILVRHSELKAPLGATRSAEEACLHALEALEELQSGAEWASVSVKYSDAQNDSLGRVADDDLSPQFADAAFELEPGELSYVVESDRGFHVILRK